MATELEATSLEVLAVLGKMTALTGRLARFVPDAVGLNVFSESSGLQIGPAVELVTSVTRLYARQVLDGSVPAVLPGSAPAADKHSGNDTVTETSQYEPALDTKFVETIGAPRLIRVGGNS
jgi:hypothetical protein